MNIKMIGSAVLAACLMIGGSAFAQNSSRHNNDNRHVRSQHDGPRNAHANRGHKDSHANRGYKNSHAKHGPTYKKPHARHYGAGPKHNFYKGSRLPSHYRSKHYVVRDWRSHRLSTPPRGYQWVQTGSDFVLVAIASGIIAQIVINGLSR